MADNKQSNVVVKRGISKTAIFLFLFNLAVHAAAIPPAWNHYYALAVNETYSWASEKKAALPSNAVALQAPQQASQQPVNTPKAMPPTLPVQQVSIEEGLVADTINRARGY